jgi:hypothetical protein
MLDPEQAEMHSGTGSGSGKSTLPIRITLSNKVFSLGSIAPSWERQKNTVKKGWPFSHPQPGCHLPNSPWSGKIKLLPAREGLVSDTPAGEGKMANRFFYSEWLRAHLLTWTETQVIWSEPRSPGPPPRRWSILAAAMLSFQAAASSNRGRNRNLRRSSGKYCRTNLVSHHNSSR